MAALLDMKFHYQHNVGVLDEFFILLIFVCGSELPTMIKRKRIVLMLIDDVFTFAIAFRLCSLCSIVCNKIAVS